MNEIYHGTNRPFVDKEQRSLGHGWRTVRRWRVILIAFVARLCIYIASATVAPHLRFVSLLLLLTCASQERSLKVLKVQEIRQSSEVVKKDLEGKQMM